MRERNLGDIRGKDGVSAGKEDRRGGRLCEESKGKEKERNGHQRPREANGLKSQGADGKGKVVAKGGNRGGGLKPNNILSNQEVVLTAMVVPRTPVAPRNQDKTQDQGNEPVFRAQGGGYWVGAKGRVVSSNKDIFTGLYTCTFILRNKSESFHFNTEQGNGAVVE